MKKKNIHYWFMVSLTIATFSFMSSGKAYALAVQDYAQIKLKIKALAPIAGGTFIYLDKNHVCGSTITYLSKSHSNYSALNASLLAAYVSGKSVSIDFRTDGNYICPANVNASVVNLCVGDDDSPCFSRW